MGNKFIRFCVLWIIALCVFKGLFHDLPLWASQNYFPENTIGFWLCGGLLYAFSFLVYQRFQGVMEVYCKNLKRKDGQ